MQLAKPDDALDSQQAVSHPPGHPMQLRQAPEATDGCLSRMRGNPHVQFLGGEGALGSLLRGTSTGSDLPNKMGTERNLSCSARSFDSRLCFTINILLIFCLRRRGLCRIRTYDPLLVRQVL